MGRIPNSFVKSALLKPEILKLSYEPLDIAQLIHKSIELIHLKCISIQELPRTIDFRSLFLQLKPLKYLRYVITEPHIPWDMIQAGLFSLRVNIMWCVFLVVALRARLLW